MTNCHFCKQKIWLGINKRCYCKNCDYTFNKQKHQIDKKVLRQEKNFITRLQCASKKQENYFIQWLKQHIIQKKI